MKKLILGFIIIALSLLFIYADAYNKGWTSVIDTNGDLTAYITFAARTDSTGSVHSKPIYVGGYNDADAYIWIKGVTASDQNVNLKFSNNLQDWEEQVMADLDACSNTMLPDTLGDAGCLAWHSNAWMVIEMDGQTAATADDIMEAIINATADNDKSKTMVSGSSRTDP